MWIQGINMKGLQQYRAYRVMLSMFRSLWFMGDVVNRTAQDLKIDIKDITFEQFGDWFFALDRDERNKLFRRAVLFGATLDPDELIAICAQRKDSNDVAIAKENIGNLKMSELTDIMADVCTELSDEKVFF